LKSHRRKFTRGKSTLSQNCSRPCDDDDTVMGSSCWDSYIFFFLVRIKGEDLFRRLGWNCFRYGSIRQSASRCCIGPIVSQQYSALCDPTSYLCPLSPYPPLLHNLLFLYQYGPTRHSLSDSFFAFSISRFSLYFCVFFLCNCLKCATNRDLVALV